MRSADVKCPPNQEVALYSLCFRTHYPIGGLEISGKVEVAHCSTQKPSEYIHNANIANANANEMQQNATRRQGEDVKSTTRKAKAVFLGPSAI